MSNILIVDDDRSTAEEMARELVNHGHRCAIQDRGIHVLDISRKHRPDLIILDVLLPDVSGFQLCRSIRSDESLYTVPVMLISVMDDEAEIQHGLAQGADDFVAKPIAAAALALRVGAILRTVGNDGIEDPQTGLHNAEGSRRELQRRLCHSAAFDLVYGELMNLRSFGKDPSAREKALRHVARALAQCGERFEKGAFFAGHMGGGHFMCIVPAGESKKFCARIEEAWDSHVEGLYESVGEGAKYADSIEKKEHDSILRLLFCTTTRAERERVTAQDLLEVISRMRKNWVSKQQAGWHRDRRDHQPPKRLG